MYYHACFFRCKLKCTIAAAQPIDLLGEEKPTEYHTITYDGYDAIEEVDINDDVVTPQCSLEPTEDSSLRPNYYALTPIKTEVNDVYTGIDTYEQPVDKDLALMARIMSE